MEQLTEIDQLTEIEHTDNNVDAGDNEEPHLFKIDVEIVLKDFTNQKSGMTKETVEIHCNTIAEFCLLVWQLIEKYIEKEIIYNESSQSYAYSYTELTSEHLEKFVLFHDKISKRAFEVLQLSTKVLHGWTGKKGIFRFCFGR